MKEGGSGAGAGGSGKAADMEMVESLGFFFHGGRVGFWRG